MGKVYTTSEDLTSIANAIRAKSGSSSNLIYPSGFISEIGNISTGNNNIWDGIGRNPVLLYTYNQSFKLSDTNWNNITISSSAQDIVNSITLDPITIDRNNYIYIGIVKTYINYQYNNNNIYPRMKKAAQITQLIRVPMTTKPSELSNFTLWTSGTLTTFSKGVYHYQSTSNNDTATVTTSLAAGIYFNYIQPNWDSSSVTLKTPSVRASISQYYFAQEAAEAIDINKTELSYVLQLYQYDRYTTYQEKICLDLEDYYNSQLE